MQTRAPFLIFLICFGLAAPSVAQDRASGWSVGAVIASAQSPYIARGQSTKAAPMLSYEGAIFTLGVNGLGVKALDGEVNKLSFHLAPRLSPLRHTSEPELAGIRRDHSLDFAMAYEYRASRRFGISARVSKGLSADQTGAAVNLGARGALRAGLVPLLMSAGASWKSAQLAQYDYGVYADEVKTDRAAYSVGPTTTPYLSIASSVPVGDNARLFGSVQADFLGNEVTNSPIVARSTLLSAALGLNYSF